jgi:pimeloyl-ACP methyl ester carboxylesterase
MTGTWKQGNGSLPLTFRRVDKVVLAAPRPQEPKKPYPYAEEEVTYENKAGASKLAGTLTTPAGKGPFTAVLLITGSGQQDRDESLLGHRPFLVLADHLTRKGIAVVRVDDRGMGGSTGDVKNATSEDFAADVLAGVEFLKKRGFGRIGLIGHSEGGMIAPMVAVRSKDVAFIVLMAGTGVNGEELLRAQASGIARAMGAGDAAIAKNSAVQDQLNSIIKKEADPQVRAARMKELRESLGLPENGQFAAAATPWFRFFLMYDPAPALRRVTCPVLAINGELDLQVPPDQNLPAIEKALKQGGNRDFQVIKLPKLTHLFQTSQTGSPAEYSKIDETIAPVALETISDWILKHN